MNADDTTDEEYQEKQYLKWLEDNWGDWKWDIVTLPSLPITIPEELRMLLTPPTQLNDGVLLGARLMVWLFILVTAISLASSIAGRVALWILTGE